MFKKANFFACWKINLSQLLLLWIILPVIYGICCVLKPGAADSSAQDIFINMFTFVPILDVAVDILSQFTSGITGTELAEISVSLIFRKFPEAVLLTMIVHFCNELFGLLYADKEPLPILSSLGGVIITTFLVKTFGLIEDNLTAFLVEIGSIVVILIGMKIMFKTFFGGSIFSLFKILLLVIDGLFSMILITYMATWYMAGTGAFETFNQAFSFLFVQTVVACVAAVITMLVRFFSQDVT